MLTAGAIEDRHPGIDANQLVHCRHVVGAADREVDRPARLLVTAAEHRRPTNSRTRVDDETALGPVIATGALVHLGGPAHLAHQHHQGVVEHPATGQIFNQRRVALVERRQKEILQQPEIVPVGVPLAGPDLAVELRLEGQADKPRSRLDQPPGGQQTRTKQVVAISLSCRLGLAGDVEGVAGAGGGEQFKGFLLEHAKCVRGRVAQSAADLVDGGQQVAATAQPASPQTRLFIQGRKLWRRIRHRRIDVGVATLDRFTKFRCVAGEQRIKSLSQKTTVGTGTMLALAVTRIGRHPDVVGNADRTDAGMLHH